MSLSSKLHTALIIVLKASDLEQKLPGILTGTALAFARAVGEYGSVIFIAGNMPGVSEVVPLLIVTKLEQYDYAGWRCRLRC